MDNINSKIAELMASDKFWKAIAEELEKQTGESRLGGRYATDLAKQMLPTLPKEQVLEFIRTYMNQQNTGNQECI